MMRLDFRSTDLAGAARMAGILADGFAVLDEPLHGELLEEESVGVDPEVRAVFEEVYGPPMAVADLPF